MGLSFEIGGVSFEDLTSSTSGRKALAIECSAEDYNIKRFHAAGSDGNILIRTGRMGRKIIASFRYIGTVAGSRALYYSDCEAFKNTSVTIVDDADYTYNYCNLDNMNVVESPRATGRVSGQVYFDVVATFTCDE